MPQKVAKQPQKPAVNKPLAVKIIVHRLDANGQILGRLATKVSNLLRGKGKPNFLPYLNCGDKVIIFNAEKIQVSGKKMVQKNYRHHTGYIGKLKSQTMAELYQKNPSEILIRAIYGMLPKNKLRNTWMKNLTVINGEENAKS